LAKKRVESWEVTDAFWQRVELLVPQRAPLPNKNDLRKPGAGRPPKPARQVFEAIVYVLRTGCQWKALPKERFGSASAIHKRFLEWEAAGFFEALWAAGLAEPIKATRTTSIINRRRTTGRVNSIPSIRPISGAGCTTKRAEINTGPDGARCPVLTGK
jgi:transposase